MSKVQTENLKNLQDANRKITARAEVHAETFAGHMPVISSAIRGSRFPEQEIICMAHLDHYKPGANDNASGSAGMLEMATTLENECRAIVPERRVDQSLNYWLAVEIRRPKGQLRAMNYDIFWDTLNLTDGKNDLVRIRDGVSAQFRELSLQQVKTLYEELKTRDIVGI